VDGSVGVFGVRNSIVFMLFYRDSQGITPVQASPLPDVLATGNRLTQRGGQLTATHNLDAVRAITATYRRTYSETTEPFPGQPTFDSTEDLFRVTFNQRLTPRTTGVVGARYVDFSSERPNSSYKEHALFVAIHHRFF
jgi:uncharacterized protein (PEP-CTERM system associated)